MCAGTLFIERPERLAAAWRRDRYQEAARGTSARNLLDNVVEDFIRQIGHTLAGVAGSAWGRTSGVLRLSIARGSRALCDEFGSLRACLLTALKVVDASPRDWEAVVVSVEEALTCALGHWRRLENPALPPPVLPFGGLVVQVIEPRQHPHAVTHIRAQDSIH